MEVLGAVVTPLQVIIIFMSILVLIGLYFFMNKTKIGRNLRAVSNEKELAEIIGINTKKVMGQSFIIGSVLAGVAGILIALEMSIQPGIGTRLIIKGFTGAIIGGVTSVPASILGSYMLGAAENFGVWYLSSA